MTVTHHKAKGGETAVQIPYFPAGDRLYVTNIGDEPLEILPKGHEPIPPGWTHSYKRNRSGDGLIVRAYSNVPDEATG